MKIIFLDIDGPLIPRRQWLHSRNEGDLANRHWTTFDRIAVSMVNTLVRDSGAKIVVSSSWREDAIPAFEENGIEGEPHEDTFTEMPNQKRKENIQAWLDRHPEVTSWVAFDDLETPSPGGIMVDFDNGISYQNYLHARKILGLDTNSASVQRMKDLLAIFSPPGL